MAADRTGLLYVIENERFGGGERAFAQLINGLDKSRYDIHVACLTGVPGSVPFLREIAGAAHVSRLDLRHLVSLGAVSGLKTIISANGIKILHSQGPRADLYSRLAAGLAGGIKMVSTVAVPVEEYDVGAARKVVYSAVDGFRRGTVDSFVAVADHIERKLLGKGVPAGKITRIYNGVDVSAYIQTGEAAGEARDFFGIPRGVFLAGAICRLSVEKGLFTLLEAAKTAAGSIPAGAVKYVIAGEGPLGPALKARVKELGMENDFVFPGFLTDVRPLLGALDLFLLPSSREGLPLALLEAMAMGKAVAASAIEGVNEVVSDGRNGLLFPPGDAAALAAIITDMFNDRSRAGELGASARKDVAAGFGLDRMLSAHDRLYRRLGAI